MKLKKQLAVAVVTIFMSTSLMLLPMAKAETPPRVMINGQELFTDVPGVIYSQRTLVPFRAILEALDAEVFWDAQNKSVIAHKGKTDITLKINNNIAWVNTQAVGLDVPAIIVNGRTMVPVRFIAESLGETVTWDADRRIVTIKTNAVTAVQPPTQTSTAKYQSGSILSADETLNYAPDYTATFKKGSKIEFYANGMVSQGTLAIDSLLKFDDATSAQFKAGSLVGFSQKGQVTKGILLQDTDLPYQTTLPNLAITLYNTDGLKATFKGGTEVVLANGLVTSGTLLRQTSLCYQYDQYALFKDGTMVFFNDKGMIVKGILAVPTSLQIIHDKYTTKDTHVYFKGETPINFKDNGYVDSGILLDDTELQYSDELWAKFAQGNLIVFNNMGYVHSGMLGKDAKLECSNHQVYILSEGNEVVFNDAGYVVSGLLAVDLNTQGGIFHTGCPVSFWDNGKIKSATLRYDSFLEYAAEKSTGFLMDTVVEFHENGYVAKGILNCQASLPYTNRIYANEISLKSNTTVEFTQDGLVSKGVLLKDEVLNFAAKKNTAFKAGDISFFDAYVSQGTLLHDTALENISGQIITYPANATITFNPDGLVISEVK